MRIKIWFSSTASPTATLISPILPDFGAKTNVFIFIASSVSKWSPSLTVWPWLTTTAVTRPASGLGTSPAAAGPLGPAGAETGVIGGGIGWAGAGLGETDCAIGALGKTGDWPTCSSAISTV